MEFNQTNEVDGEQVPIRHFGVILTTNDWDRLRDKLESKEINLEISESRRPTVSALPLFFRISSNLDKMDSYALVVLALAAINLILNIVPN